MEINAVVIWIVLLQVKPNSFAPKLELFNFYNFDGKFFFFIKYIFLCGYIRLFVVDDLSYRK